MTVRPLFLLCSVGFAIVLQALEVRLTPEVIYAGDAFQLDVSQQGAQVVSVTPVFSTPTQTIGQSTRTISINGKTTSSVILQILPSEVGICRLESLTAQLSDGRTLTYQQPKTVQVRELLPDPDVSLTIASTPEHPLPGDEVRIRITVKAPALNSQGTLCSPFLAQDFFRGLQERVPQVNFNPTTSEDSPLRQLAQPQLESRSTEGERMVWQIVIPYQAVRVGEQVFPAPVIRDVRYTLDETTKQLAEQRCTAIGVPLTITVNAPPEEGRPEGFTGAVASTFQAAVRLDALNVNVGDPVKLTITFKSDAAAEQIRMPQLPTLEGFRLYGDPQRETFEGGCSFTYNLRPIQQGLLEIPALTFAWFEREAREYRVEHTAAVPLYAHPSAQLVLLGDDGEQFSSVLPPALRLDEGNPAPRATSGGALIAFLIGLFAYLLRLTLPILKRFGAALAAPILRRRPTARACLLLKRAQTATEALAILREWSGAPALTSAELRHLLPASEEAQQAITAMMQLEQAVYVGGDDFQRACTVLCEVLPKLSRPNKRSSNVKLGVFLILLFLPVVATASSVSFLREQALFVTLSASTPQDYGRAVNLWLDVEATGEMEQSALLNAASCALFARYPVFAEQLIQRYEIRYGADTDSERVHLVIADQLEREPYWWRTLFKLHYSFSMGSRIALLLWVGGLFLLLCAIPWKGLEKVRIALAIVAILLVTSVCISANQLKRLDALRLPTAETVEEI